MSYKAYCKLEEHNLKPFDYLAYTAYDVPVKGKRDFDRDKITIPLKTENLFSYKHYILDLIEVCINQMKEAAKNRGASQSILFKYEDTLKFIRDTKGH